MYHYHLWTSLLLFIIYHGSCLHSTRFPLLLPKANEGELVPTVVNTNDFTVEWSGNGKYTVTIDGPTSNLCEVVGWDCSTGPLCSFQLSKQFVCNYLNIGVLDPCTHINVNVAKDGKNQSVEFNLAADINLDAIDPKLDVDGNKASLNWTNSLVTNLGGDISCATRVKASLQVGDDDSDWMDGPALDVGPDASSSTDWPLDYCQHGDLKLKAKVVYLTTPGDFPTFNEIFDNDKQTFSGVGVKSVTASESDVSCSLDASWDVGCSEAVDYTVTCGGKEYEDIAEQSYSCSGLTAGSQSITVQAYLGEETIGDTKETSKEVSAIAPDAPTMAIANNNATPRNLSVTWNQPKTALCAVDPTGHTIKYKVEGSADDPEEIPANASPTEFSDLEPCTPYSVFIVANSDQGDVESDTKVEKTGSTAPGKPTVDVDGSSTTSITLSWNPTAADSCPLANYKVEWSGEPITTTDTSYTFGDLKCNTQYTVTVTANTEDDKHSTSEETKPKTDDKAPGKTKALVVSSVDENPNQLTATWSGPDDYTCTGALGQYNMTWTAEGDGGTKNVTDTATDIDDLVPCTFYTISVAARSNTDLQGLYETSTATKTSVDVPGKSTDVVKNSDAPYFMKVEWKAPSDNPCEITSYTVQWTEANTRTMQEHNVTETTYNIISLNACTDYDITVTAFTEKGAGEPTGTVKLTTGKDVPAKSTNLTNTSVTANSLTVSWSPPKDDRNPCSITNYTVQWVISGSGAEPEKATVTEESYPITGLIACTDYDISIIAYTEKGPGDPSETVTFTTDTDVPGKSRDVAKNGDEPYSMKVEWKRPLDNPCEITKYTVQWADDKSADVTDPTYTIHDLNACTTYDITVTAFTVKGAGDPTETAKLTTGTDVPAKSTDLTNTIFTANSLTVSWSPPKDSRNPCSITNYTVQWVISGSGSEPEKATVTEESYPITGLIACTDYDISIIAYTEKGPGDPSETVTFTTDTDFPGISSNIAMGNFTPYSLNVNWIRPPISPPDGNPCPINNYTVQWSNSSDEANVKTEIVTEPHLNITDLAACTDYYITVIACTEKGPGKSSEADKMSTGVDAPPVAKDKVIITPTSRDAQVNWEKPVTSCNLTYEVKHSGNTMWTNNNISDPVKKQTIEDPFHSAILDELFPYSKYDVCVTVNNNVNGEKTCKTFTTEEAVPSDPRNVSVEDVDDVSLTLTWEFPAAENGILLNYIVSWGDDGETTTNHTVDADITSHSIYELEEGKYFFSVKAVNSKGSSIQSESIEQEMNGPTACGGGCIAGIVIGILLVALAIPAFIFRDRIMHKIKPGPPPVEESPYELRGAAILKSDFRRHVEELGLDRAERAYQMLNDESQQKTKFAAAKPFNKGKNRFANIHPFDETRVKLQLMRNGPKGSDYINANHITFPDTFALEFIATQGPLDSTINDFWRMIWEHKVYDTVMLCNLFEKGKSKCAQYWTENGERSMEFGDFKISCQAEEEDMSKTFITRYIDVFKDGQHRMVKQHHFLAWPDFGVPENEEGLLRFLASVKRNVNEHGTNVLTHCSAGVGRTGTFIALWVLTSLLEQNNSAKSIDVHQISLMMREGRSDMIQTKDQYLYLHKCLLKYMEDTGSSFPISNKDDEEPIYGNVNTGYQQ